MRVTRIVRTRSGRLVPMTFEEWLERSGWDGAPLPWWPAVPRGDGYEIHPNKRGRLPRARGRGVPLMERAP